MSEEFTREGLLAVCSESSQYNINLDNLSGIRGWFADLHLQA